MKIWTFGEMDDKVRADLDLQDFDYIPFDEMVGYANEAIDEIEATIHNLGEEEDYFLRRGVLPLTEGETQYSPPADLYAMKIRGMLFLNGSDRYAMKRVRRQKKFETISDLQYQASDAEPYRWFWHNPSVELGYQIELHRPASETTGALVTAPVASPGVFTSTLGLVNGEQVRLFTSSRLPTGVREEKTYYVVSAVGNNFGLALTSGGAAINLTVAGVGTHHVARWPLVTPLWYIRNARRIPLSTEAISVVQGVADARATQIDIPEFSNFVMQILRWKCVTKEPGDFCAGQELAILEQQRKMMQNTLSVVVPDDDDEVPQDLSAYEEHS